MSEIKRDVCPLMSIIHGEETNCILTRCNWYVRAKQEFNIGDECLFVGINRNLLDTWLTMRKAQDDAKQESDIQRALKKIN